MTELGILFVVAAFFVLLFKRSVYPALLAVAAAFPTSAAVIVAGNAISPFYLLAIPAVVMLPSLKARMEGRGKNALLIFAAWSLVVSVLSPFLFHGIDVLVPRSGIDAGVIDPAQLQFTVSNIAQMGYLFLAVGVVFYLVKIKARPSLVAVTFGVGTVLSFAHLICLRLSIPFVVGPLFWNGTASYVSGSVGGVTRLRGVFAEPSLLAEFSVAATAFFAFMVFSAKGSGRVKYLVLAVMAALNLLATMTGTGTGSMVIVGAMIAVYCILRFMHKGSGAFLLTEAILLLGVVVLLAGENISGWIRNIFTEKVGSQSELTRSASNEFSWGVFAETFGLGAGLGSNRPSSFFLMLVSCVGVIGTLAFLVLALRLVVNAGRTRAGLPVAWGLVALLVAKVMSVPDMSVPILWMLIAGCASSYWTMRVPRSDMVLGRYGWEPLAERTHGDAVPAGAAAAVGVEAVRRRR